MRRQRPARAAVTRPVAGPVALLLAAVLLLGACGGGQEQRFTGQTHDPYEVAATPLTATTGKAYSLAADTTKPLTLVFFGYTHCEDICPAVVSNLAAAMTRLSAADRRRVDVVFVTTDPARDDVARLRDWLGDYDKDFVGLTGGLDEIVAIARRLAVYVSDGTRLPSGGYDLTTHSTVVTAIGADDTARVLWNQQTTPGQYAADIHALLEDQS